MEEVASVNCCLLSNYCVNLDKEAKDRYLEKIKVVNKIDPYCIPKAQWITDVNMWPNVTYPDIVTYLIFTKSAYTADDLKSYKSLEAYNQFVSGWVREIGVVKPPNATKLRILSGRVSILFIFFYSDLNIFPFV